NALALREAIDVDAGRLLDLGAVVGATADQGMNAKITADGSPNVLYLEDMLEAAFGEGFRVICPITDPYVKHHGALGPYALIHVTNKDQIAPVKNWLAQQPGITEVNDKQEAVSLLQ